MRALGYFLKTGIFLCLFFCFSPAVVRGQMNKLIVIDPLVAEESEGIISRNSDAKVYFLPDKGNPLQLIAAEMKKDAYDEVHLYLLTKPGSIIFDEMKIIPDNVRDYSADFSDWKDNLQPDAVITIHSSELTSVPEGLVLVNSISAFTGRKVLAEL